MAQIWQGRWGQPIHAMEYSTFQKERVDVELYPSTNFGYDIMAPLGLSFGCYRPGSALVF